MCNNLSEQTESEIFWSSVTEGKYENILARWGADPLIELLKWYQYIEYHHGISALLKCLKDYSEEYYL